MPDMLVNLRNLPEPLIMDTVEVRRANTWDETVLCTWISRNFSSSWAECACIALQERPVKCFVKCFVIVEKGTPSHPKDLLLGFACYDVAAKGVFGPMAVLPSAQKGGLSSALLVHTLYAMRSEGYAYGIIGQVGPADFYTKVVGATQIPGSDPGSARTFLADR